MLHADIRDEMLERAFCDLGQFLRGERNRIAFHAVRLGCFFDEDRYLPGLETVSAQRCDRELLT